MLHSKAVLSADGTATRQDFALCANSLKITQRNQLVRVAQRNKSRECTCGGSAQDHWVSPGDAEVPDPVPVAHVLLDLLAQTLGRGVGSQAGYNLAGTNAGLFAKSSKVTVANSRTDVNVVQVAVWKT